MILLNIPGVKEFMTKLLASPFFDHLILKEMEINTFTSFHISGKFYKEFYSDEEIDLREYPTLMWSDIREIAFAIIKGNKNPLSMKIVLQFPPEQTKDLLGKIGQVHEDNVGGLFINVRFEKGKLNIVTASAMKTFTMDKTLDYEWDARVKEILRESKIAFEEE